VTEWEPATEAEAAMRDALRGGDQEEYFRVLARTELLLPVSADSITGQTPVGWGTWTTSGRTHVLAFTSGIALQACLAENAGSARRMAYQELAAAWPNLEWWLAVNPGLPIEGYLPAWFVTQLARGDVRLPGRSMAARARLEKAESAARARATAVVPGRIAPPGTEPTSPAPGSAPTSPAGAGFGAASAAGLVGAGAGGLTSAGPGGLATPAQSGLAAASPGGFATGGSGGLTMAAPGGPREADQSAPAEGPQSGLSMSGGSPRGLGGGEGGAGSSGFGQVGAGSSGPSQSDLSSAFPGSRGQSGLGGAGLSGGGFGRGGMSGAAPSTATPASTGPDSRTIDGGPTPPDGPGYRGPGPSSPTYGGPPASAVSPLAAAPPPPVPDAPSALSGGGAGSGGLPRRVAGTAPPIPLGPIGANLPPINPQPGASAAAASAPPASAPPSSGAPADTGVPAAVSEGGPRPWDTPPATQAWDPNSTGAPTQPWEPTTNTGTPTQPWEAPAAAPAAPAQQWGERREPAPQAQKPPPPPIDFKPANDLEKTLLAAAAEGSTDNFLSTLLLAKVLLPVSPVSADGTRPGEPGFAWLTETLDSEPYVVVFTSMDRIQDHLGEPIETIDVKFMQLIKAWPDPTWAFAVNPSTPVGAKLPGAQILALANWAADVGLGGDTDEIEPASRPAKKSVTPDPNQPTLMQKAVAPSQVDYYIERGYDRVSGFVHRANEVAHLSTPAKVYTALGLGYAGSAFKRDADEIYVLRWPAYRPSLYRIPYGGQNEPAMRAMEGWVIERAPFRGNGFAPSDSGDVIAEFKVDSARLPHGAQLWRITADGTEKLVALLDADAPTWRKVGDE